MVMQPSKIVWLCRCSVSTQKTNLCRFFLQCWRLQDSNFNSTGLRHRDLFKKQKNLAKVNFLKLLTKENLLKCFHQFTAYQKRRQIFAHRNFVEKSMSKRVSRSTVGISTREITSKKVRGNNVDLLVSKIIPKKLGNNVDFSISEITIKKVRGNYVEIC